MLHKEVRGKPIANKIFLGNGLHSFCSAGQVLSNTAKSSFWRCRSLLSSIFSNIQAPKSEEEAWWVLKKKEIKESKVLYRKLKLATSQKQRSTNHSRGNSPHPVQVWNNLMRGLTQFFSQRLAIRHQIREKLVHFGRRGR